MTDDCANDIILAALQRHIEQALEDLSLPPLRAEQFRANLASVKAARDRIGVTPLVKR